MAIKIDPELYYAEDTLRIQGLDSDALAKARREGGLRAKRVGSFWVYKGAWLIEWLDRAEAAPTGRAGK